MSHISRKLKLTAAALAVFATAAVAAPQAMAGTASVSGGNLTVQGDTAANKLQAVAAGSGVVVVVESSKNLVLLPGAGCGKWYTNQAVVCTGVNIVTMNGAGGDDQLIGTNNTDILNGGAGRDDIRADNGGNTAGDWMFGNGGNDTLYGSDTGADYAQGGTGNDTAVTNGGNDVVDMKDGQQDGYVDCGTGNSDSLVADSASDTSGYGACEIRNF